MGKSECVKHPKECMAHKFSANIIALDVSPQVLPEFQESDSALRSGEKNRDL